MLVPAMKAASERMVRRRKIENIWRTCDREKAALGTPTFATRRNPKLYLGFILLLAVLGSSVFKAADSAVQRRAETPLLRAMRHVDVLAEALGRYRFHIGVYPLGGQGLAALVRDPDMPGWDGPYINQLVPDPWGTPYAYEPPREEGQEPVVLSFGADRTRGTPDDIRPDPARFDPGTAWTNDWVSARERLPGVTILPTE
jgi:general secretion pathway protein G